MSPPNTPYIIRKPAVSPFDIFSVPDHGVPLSHKACNNESRTAPEVFSCVQPSPHNILLPLIITFFSRYFNISSHFFQFFCIPRTGFRTRFSSHRRTRLPVLVRKAASCGCRSVGNPRVRSCSSRLPLSIFPSPLASCPYRISARSLCRQPPFFQQRYRAAPAVFRELCPFSSISPPEASAIRR